mmetsp:Transcript_39002/g.120527  ORF Transcript_39002/g.120527 Transcript_39002/m.120527 type:complete len:225 (+) Transcript_39002:2041-2715(+)
MMPAPSPVSIAITTYVPSETSAPMARHEDASQYALLDATSLVSTWMVLDDDSGSATVMSWNESVPLATPPRKSSDGEMSSVDVTSAAITWSKKAPKLYCPTTSRPTVRVTTPLDITLRNSVSDSGIVLTRIGSLYVATVCSLRPVPCAMAAAAASAWSNDWASNVLSARRTRRLIRVWATALEFTEYCAPSDWIAKVGRISRRMRIFFWAKRSVALSMVPIVRM